jgi:hypothetical protein
MKRLLLVALLFCLSLTARAVEVGGVVLEDSAHLGNSNLLLNGAGVRSKYFFDLYTVALYLSAKKNSAAAVLADAKEKRIELYMLRGIRTEDMLYRFRSSIENNHTDEELHAMKDELHEFENVFHQMLEVQAGDVILLDYQPAIGTQLTLNGTLRGTIPGRQLYTALLKIWLGEQPAQDDLKLKLLGGQ